MANSASSNELHSITKHNNIVISGVGSNEVLKFDGSNWINQTLGEAGIAPVATPTFTTSITIGSASMTEADLERVEDITPGTAAASKAVVLDGSTNITGIGTISSGAITATTSITLNARGELRFADADSSNYVALESPATVGTSYTMTLPADLPAADEVLTVTSYSSGAGVLEWAAAAGGDQTPWTADVNAANYELDNVGNAESSWTNGVLYIARTSAPRIELEGHGADENPILMRFNKSRHASLGGHTALASGDEIMQILARGSNGSAFLNGAIITAATTEAWSGSARGTKLEFSTTANTTTSTGVKMKIDHDGAVTVYEGGDAVSVQGGLAKAFVRFYNTTMESKWNVSSITDHNPGDWTVNMTNGMATANDHTIVCVPKSGDPTTNAIAVRPANDNFTATTCRITGINISGAAADPSGGGSPGVCAVIYGVF